MALLGSRLKWKLISVHLETVLILMQDMCTVWAKHTMALEMIFDAPDGTPRDVGHVKSRFGPFGDSLSVSAR
jgi:hypothetical protein